MDRTLKKSELIGKSQELRKLLTAPNRLPGDTVSIRFAPAAKRRVAFITRGIKPATARNRVRRQLKEIYRLNKLWFPENFEYLFIAQPKTVGQKFSALCDEVKNLARRLTNA